MQGRLQSKHRIILEPLGFKFERELLTVYEKCNHNDGNHYPIPRQQCVDCYPSIRCKSDEGCNNVQIRGIDTDLCTYHFAKKNGKKSAEIEAGEMIDSMVEELNTANKDKNIKLIIKQQVMFGHLQKEMHALQTG